MGEVNGRCIVGVQCRHKLRARKFAWLFDPAMLATRRSSSCRARADFFAKRRLQYGFAWVWQVIEVCNTCRNCSVRREKGYISLSQGRRSPATFLSLLP